MVPWSQLRQPFLDLFRVTVDWPDFWIDTFQLVIRLSKVKQLAFPFCTFVVLLPWSHLTLWELRSYLSEAGLNSQKLHFFAAASIFDVTFKQQHETVTRQVHALQVWFSFFWCFFEEVKHIVHLIRWNSYSRLMPSGTTGPRSRRGVTHDL